MAHSRKKHNMDTVAQELARRGAAAMKAYDAGVTKEKEGRREAIQAVIDYGNVLREGREMFNADIDYNKWIKENGLDQGVWANRRERSEALKIATVSGVRTGPDTSEVGTFDVCPNTRPSDMMKWYRVTYPETEDQKARANAVKLWDKGERNLNTIATKIGKYTNTKNGVEPSRGLTRKWLIQEGRYNPEPKDEKPAPVLKVVADNTKSKPPKAKDPSQKELNDFALSLSTLGRTRLLLAAMRATVVPGKEEKALTMVGIKMGCSFYVSLMSDGEVEFNTERQRVTGNPFFQEDEK